MDEMVCQNVCRQPQDRAHESTGIHGESPGPIREDPQHGALEESRRSAGSHPAQEQVHAKSRAMPAHQIPVEVAEDEIDSLDQWDVMDASSTSHVASTEMIDALQVRVLNMEGALAEILGHLRQGN